MESERNKNNDPVSSRLFGGTTVDHLHETEPEHKPRDGYEISMFKMRIHDHCFLEKHIRTTLVMVARKFGNFPSKKIHIL